MLDEGMTLRGEHHRNALRTNDVISNGLTNDSNAWHRIETKDEREGDLRVREQASSHPKQCQSAAHRHTTANASRDIACTNRERTPSSMTML